jgi:hypothetical protein
MFVLDWDPEGRMNKYLKNFLIPVAVVVVYFFVFHNKPELRFYNKLVRYQNNFVDVFDEFVECLHSDMQIGLEKIYQKMADQAEESLQKADALETIEGGEELHDAVLNLLSLFADFAENDGKEIVMLSLGENLSPGDKERVLELSRNFDAEKNTMTQLAREAEQRYLEKFNLEED